MKKFNVTRSVALSQPVELTDKLESSLSEISAISEYRLQSPTRLKIEYDLNSVDFSDLHSKFENIGLCVKSSIFHKLLYAYWSMSDQNIRANLKVPAHCCNKAPK
jgi:hypothetical protein